MKHHTVKILLALVLVLPACVSQAVKDQARETSRAHDQYANLVQATLDGRIQPEDGLPVTKAELLATPASVKLLLRNVVRALYLSRRAWHQANFAANDGPDPATLDLEPPSELEGE